MSGSKRVPHCVLQTSWTFSEADLKERVDKNENKAKPVQLLLHLTTQVILKLKIVFNLCLCSFFKRTRNKSNQNLNSYHTKDEDSHYLCFCLFLLLHD